jgi:hypothetical protein
MFDPLDSRWQDFLKDITQDVGGLKDKDYLKGAAGSHLMHAYPQLSRFEAALAVSKFWETL